MTPQSTTSAVGNGTESCDDINEGFICKTDQSHHWGQYSPYFTISSSTSTDIPDLCQITFAQILSRHGARDPTALKSGKYRDLMEHIQKTAGNFRGVYKFLQTYRYTLGADQLTTFGEQELVNSGMKYYHRYQALAKDTVPFVRSAGQERVVESAQNWTQGFHAARAADKAATVPDKYPYDIVVINEGETFNNTLSHDTCPKFETSIAEDAQSKWASIFIPALSKRINRNLVGANLNTELTIHLMDMCPFDTVASPLGTISPFCKLFTHDDWVNYDYYQTLGKYYGYSNGNPLGAAQGIGFVNELIARMTNTPVDDHTNTNSTLDDSEKTFPLGKTSLYADFSHDNDITEIFAALGLYNATKPPPKTHKKSPKELSGYTASWTVPFAARAYFEKMKCDGQKEEYVRVLVNDRVMPLQACGGDALGRCTLSKFVDSLSFARSGGNWDKCFV
jgi:hypothetical protein